MAARPERTGMRNGHRPYRRNRCSVMSAMLFTACGPRQQAVRAETVTVDGTMLTMSVPDALVASPIAGGLTLRPQDAALRRGFYEMGITLHRATRDTMLRLDRVRGRGPAAIRYGILRDEGGSGGEEITLLAERSCARTTVRLQLHMQAEGEAIDLEPVFAILDSARCASVGQNATKRVGHIMQAYSW